MKSTLELKLIRESFVQKVGSEVSLTDEWVWVWDWLQEGLWK
jgi:hypothetical protein